MTTPDPREEQCAGLLELLFGIDARIDDLAARRTANQEGAEDA